jgi:hypothetical protein
MGLPVRPAKPRDGQARQAEPPEGPGHSPPVCLGGSGNHAGRAVQGCPAPDGQVRAGLRRQPATEDLSGPVPRLAAVGQNRPKGWLREGFGGQAGGLAALGPGRIPAP